MSPENDAQAGDVAAAVPAVSPGAMIRQGRERMNLSLDELAGVTKLSYNTIESLERDDFSSLLEAVYVRGYYRKCAKVLDLSEKALLDAYESRVAPKQVLPPAKLRLASGADLGSTSRLPLTLAIVGAVIAVLVCAVVWVARGKGQPAPSEPTPATVSTEAPAATSGSVVVDSTVAAVPAPVEVPETAAADPSAPAPAAAAAAVPATPVAPAPSTVPAPAPAAAVTTAPAAAPTTQSAVFSFSAASWVRVDDAGGKTLFNGLAQAGESHVLSGTLPLNVFLGNAPAVKVEFGGRAFDTQAFQRDNKTARFTLPARN